MGVLGAAISNEVKFACCMYNDCDKQIIAGIINSSKQFSEGRNVDQICSSFIKPTNG